MVAVVSYETHLAVGRRANIPWLVELAGAAAFGTDRANMSTIADKKHLDAIVTGIGHQQKPAVRRKTKRGWLKELTGTRAP